MLPVFSLNSYKMTDWNELHKTMNVKGPHPKVVSFVGEYLKPGMKVLDLGCGKGRHSIYCAEKGLDVFAVDISDNALNVLEKGKGKLPIEIIQSDIKKMPFSEDYFDAIITVNVINHGYWKDIRAYFKEATRVLKRGALLHVIGLPIEFLEDSRTEKTEELEPGTFVKINSPDGDLPHHGLTQDEVRELLKDYKIIKSENFKENSPWLNREVTHLEIIARKK